MTAPSPSKPVAVAGGIAILVSAGGALLTSLGPWYYALKRPHWQPPDWLFGPVWTTIFILATLAAVLSWQRARSSAQRRRIVLLFALNIAFNLLWSLLFFRLQRPDLALYEVPLLWLSIAALMIGLWPLSRVAASVLLPYLVWVSFAATLNLAIVRLNAPFT